MGSLLQPLAIGRLEAENLHIIHEGIGALRIRIGFWGLGFRVGALTIRIGFCCYFYCNYKKEPLR